MTAPMAACLVLIWASGCVEDLGIPKVNREPIAVARVQGTEDKNPAFEYKGSPVEVTLDGSQSFDPDGKIVTYRWLSGDLATGDEDGGTPHGRARPAGTEEGWPEDTKNPIVHLGEGVHTFVLWVIDDRGTVSLPSSVEITIQKPVDENVARCVDTVLPTVKRSCATCVCGVSDDCRAAADQSMCNEDCWNLLQCIADKCPDYAMTGDTSCVAANCLAYVAAGSPGATAIGPCVVACPNDCQ